MRIEHAEFGGPCVGVDGGESGKHNVKVFMLSPDGKTYVYTPIDREFRSWKRYRGGRAQDVWTYNLADNTSKRLTDNPATDNQPVWVGNTIYFTSDRNTTMNLFAMSPEGGDARQLTHFSEFDVLWPSAGKDAIVFENGGAIWRFDPVDRPATALRRRNDVLTRMVATGRLTEEQAAVAKAQPLGLKLSTPPNGCAVSTYPIYCQWVKDTIASDPAFGATSQARQELLFRGGLRITTALDPAVQAQAQRAVSEALQPTNRVAGAVAVVQPGSGQVLALASNRPWGSDVAAGQSEVPYPVLANFQPGSTFKPITLAAALTEGVSLDNLWEAPPVYTPAD